MDKEENKIENLQILKDFLENDMKIKETLINLAPSEIDDVDEASRIKYTDKLHKGLKGLKGEFLSGIKNFEFGPEVDRAINEHFEKAEEALFIGKYEPGICQRLYKSQISRMEVQFIEDVKEKCAGYVLKENKDLARLIEKAKTANELLHVMHSYIVNNDEILEKMPIIDEKINTIGENITLYGEENEVAKDIYDKFPLELDCGTTDIISLQNKILMMIRDRGHALSIDMDTSKKDKIATKYFVPKLCNKEMIEKLPGINKCGITENGATGLFISSKDKIIDDLFGFIEKVPTDNDIVIEHTSFRREDIEEIVFESGKNGRKIGEINLIQQKIKDEKIKTKEVGEKII